MAVICLCTYADAPSWLDASMRSTLYRPADYYSGFAVTDIRHGENTDAATQRATTQARSELVSSIRMSIRVENYNEIINKVYGADQVRTLETYKSASTQKAGAENIPGVQVEVYVDNNARMAYAFAYVEIRGLGRKLEKQLMATLSKIEIKLEDAKTRAANGEKGAARDILSSLPQLFEVVEETQATMLAVDATLSKDDIMQDEYALLRKQTNALNSELSDGYAICIQGKADLFGTSYPSLVNSLKGELSKQGCYFVDSESGAEWVIRIDAQAEEYNTVNFGSSSTYYAYAIATISISKMATGKCVWEDEIRQKGGHTLNYKEAAKVAYVQLESQLAQLIINQLK